MYLSDAVRNARLDAVETTIGTAAIIRFYDGTPPADETTALSSNTLLAEGTLPSDWMAGASAGSKGKSGTWTLNGQSGAGAGTDARFGRIAAGPPVDEVLRRGDSAPGPPPTAYGPVDIDALLAAERERERERYGS